MTLSLDLPPELENRLRERAAHTGQPVELIATRLLSSAISSETIDEILAPARAQAAESGMTEGQLMDFGRELLERVRRERPAGQP